MFCKTATCRVQVTERGQCFICIGTYRYMCQTHCYIVQVLIRYVCWEVKGHCTMYISSLHQLNTCRSVYTLLTVTVPVKFLGTVISQGLIAKFS